MAINILKAEQVKKLSYSDDKKSLNDGGGLRIVVKADETKVWKFLYTFNGIRKDTSFGTYPNVTLSGARVKAKEFRELLENNCDPIEQVKIKKTKAKEEKLKNKHLIGNIVDKYLILKQYNNKLKDTTIAKAIQRLNNHFFKYLPNKENTIIHNITYEKLVTILERIEQADKLETLFRVKLLIIEVFKYAYTEGILKDTSIFAKLELKTFKTKSKSDIRNNPTLTKKEDIKKLYNSILRYEFSKLTRYALLLTIHTAQRQGSIISAKWSDINFDTKLWSIPAEQMKMKKEHNLPLSNELISYLKELYEITGDNIYLFPNSQYKYKHMSNNTVTQALRKMGFTKEEQTAHGFRAMFKTVCKEHQEEHNLNNEFVERILAHKVDGDVEGAYNRANSIEDMRKIVNWWSEYLER